VNRHRARRQAAVILLISGLLGFALAGPQGGQADPGIAPVPGGTLAFLDFSPYPNGAPLQQGVVTWTGQGWTAGAGSLQLLYPGAFVEVVFQVPSAAPVLQLKLTHRSAYAPGCPDQGFAPVTVTVNDALIAQNHAPPAGSGAVGFTTNAWEITGRVVPGSNRIRVVAGRLCSPYEVRRIEIAGASGASPLVEEYQMTHGIRNNRPVDATTAFSPTDERAMLWVRVIPGVVGRWIEWKFYQPSGQLYFEYGRFATRYNWGWINIQGRRAARLLGQWRVDFFVEGQRQLSVPFTIGRGTPPRITFIEFPGAITADGEKNWGKVHFYDPDGDIVFVEFEVVQAAHFNPFSFDPDVEGQTSGSFGFYVYARTRQTVTLKVTLFDRQGNASEPYLFTFQVIWLARRAVLVGSFLRRLAENRAIVAPLLAGLAEEMWTIGGINVLRVPAGLTHERSAADDPRAAVLALYDPGLNPRVHVAPPSCLG